MKLTERKEADSKEQHWPKLTLSELRIQNFILDKNQSGGREKIESGADKQQVVLLMNVLKKGTLKIAPLCRLADVPLSRIRNAMRQKSELSEGDLIAVKK